MTSPGSEAAPKQLVSLVVYIDAADSRWHVAAVDSAGNVVPLLRSQAGNLAGSEGGTLDERLAFLRHRLAGVIQRGCDRLWGRQMKAAQVVFICDGNLPPESSGLTDALAQHFATWLANPPVVFFHLPRGGEVAEPSETEIVAGEIPGERLRALQKAFAELVATRDVPAAWETVEQPAKSKKP